MKDGAGDEDAQVYACAGKDPLTRTQARDIAKRMRTRRKAPLMAYRCGFCQSWHVGNRPFGLRKRGKK